MKDKTEAKTGYKKTKLGWIPEEWEILKLSNILKEGTLGGNFENNETFTGLPLIKMGNIGRGRIKLEKVEKVPKSIDFDEEHILKEGDFLFNTRNTLDLVGKVAVWRNEIPKALYNSNLMRMTFDNKKVYSNYFMSYFFNSYNGLRQLKSFAIGTTSVAAIYTRDLIKLTIPLPPLPEQQKIAQILSTWDRAIEKTEQLIAAKEKLKKGLMQQLLSGKRRFRKFKRSKWRKVKIGNFGKVITGNTPSKAKQEYWGGNFSWATAHDLKNKYVINTTEKITEKGKSVSRMLPKGSVLVTCIASIGLNAIAGENLATNQKINSIIVDEQFDNEFVYYIIEFNKNKLIAWAGITALPILNKKSFEKLPIVVPENKNEQVKISQTLLSCDKEIELLKQKLKILNQQKKGLMQVLLTGRKRVETQ